jgi:putative toxin-antitoxin system antitoxin component (TIGR02293 family)
MTRVKEMEKTSARTGVAKRAATASTKVATDDVEINQVKTRAGSIGGLRATARARQTASDRLAIFRVDPQARIEIIREGIPAKIVADLSSVMGMSKESILSSLGLNRATISRKEKVEAALSKDESEKVLGMGALINLVQTMVEQSGEPEGFDAARWVSAWLAKPLPALGGKTPASYMDTFEGQKLIADLLAMSQSGAYA